MPSWFFRKNRSYGSFLSRVWHVTLPFDLPVRLCYKENMVTGEQLIRQANPETQPSDPDATFAPVNTQNLSHLIAQRLTQAIREEKIKPGEKLPSEKELMALFQVGRSSVREALHSLVVSRLVEVRPGKGYYIRQHSETLCGEELVQFVISEKDFLNVMEARERIEPEIALLAAQRALPEDLRRLEEAYAEIEQSMAQGKYYYTGDIHLGITRAAHNPVFVRIMEALLPLFPCRVRGRTIPVDTELGLHRKLIDGLRTGKGRTMHRLMREHLQVTREFYVTAMREDHPPVHKEQNQD